MWPRSVVVPVVGAEQVQGSFQCFHRAAVRLLSGFHGGDDQGVVISRFFQIRSVPVGALATALTRCARKYSETIWATCSPLLATQRLNWFSDAGYPDSFPR